MTLKIKIIPFCLFLMSVFSCNNEKTALNNNQEKPDESFLSGIRTTKAVLTNREQELTLTGRVEANPDREIRFVPLVSGVIDRVYFSLGDKVQQGQTLMDIRSTELSALQSELVSLEGELRISERELKIAGDMYADQIISEKDLLEARIKQKQAQAAFDRIRTDVSVYGTNKGNGVFSIKAQMNGYITAKNVSAGSTVPADSESLFTIADLNTVWIIANIYASDLLFAREGMEAQITSLSYPGEIFTGTISNIPQVFDPEDKALKARIVLSNKDLKLKPGMSVVIRIRHEDPEKQISIPSDALIFDNDRYFVVASDNENFKVKEVFIESQHNGTTCISSGLSEGENIVIKNQLLLYTQLLED